MKEVRELQKALYDQLNEKFLGRKTTADEFSAEIDRFITKQFNGIIPKSIKFEIENHGGDITIHPHNLQTVLALSGITATVLKDEGEFRTEFGTYGFKNGKAYFIPAISNTYVNITLNDEEKK